ncbi:peptidase [Helicobacter monodelphidis]|nr:peptidase [Helicobacter sp. 15-1451]
MQDKFTITITDLNGSKQYNIHQFAKYILFYVLLFIFTLILVAFISIKLLLGEISTIEEKRNSLIEEYNTITQKNEDLEAEITQKSNDLKMINGRVRSLEGFIGLSESEEMNSTLTVDPKEILNRVDLAQITAEQKGFTMRLIPNGSPMEGDVQVSSSFGYRSHPLMKRREFHTGTDIRTPIGTPIYSTADGVVAFSQTGYNGGYGVMVKIDHAYGFRTVYAHLSKSAVSAGEFVKKGQLIAYSGNTGLSTGPHLHYEVLFLGDRLNPRSFIAWTMRNYDHIFAEEEKVKWKSLMVMIDGLREAVNESALVTIEGSKEAAKALGGGEEKQQGKK